MKTTISPRTVRSMRGIAATLTLILTLVGLLAPRVAAAPPERTGTFPYQSFVDNFVGPNSPLDYVPVLGSEDISFVKGSLNLSSANAGYWLALAKAAKNGDDIVAESTSMRAVVRCSDASGVALWTRNGFFVCRLLPVAVDGSQWQLQIADFWGNGMFPNLSVQSVDIDGNLAGKDVVVEFDTIGSTLTARAWELENPANFYEISWALVVDEYGPFYFPTGTVGIGALGYTAPEPGAPVPVVSYYQFKLKIIPPTSDRR